LDRRREDTLRRGASLPRGFFWEIGWEKEQLANSEAGERKEEQSARR